MTEEHIARMECYFARQMDACTRQQQRMERELREDEAVFERIRANVYGIFRTVLSVAAKRDGGEDFFRQRLTQIPESWQAAYAQARQHGDAVQMRLEQLKLDTAEEIRAAFDRLEEGAE